MPASLTQVAVGALATLTVALAAAGIKAVDMEGSMVVHLDGVDHVVTQGEQ